MECLSPLLISFSDYLENLLNPWELNQLIQLADRNYDKFSPKYAEALPCSGQLSC